ATEKPMGLATGTVRSLRLPLTSTACCTVKEIFPAHLPVPRQASSTIALPSFFTATAPPTSEALLASPPLDSAGVASGCVTPGAGVCPSAPPPDDPPVALGNDGKGAEMAG